MADLTYVPKPLFVAGQPNNVEDIHDRFDEVRDYLNGFAWVDESRLAAEAVTNSKASTTLASENMEAAGDNARLGLSTSSTVRRGKSIISTEESFTQTSYGFATTPDRVQNVVLPTDGLIFVAFQGAWKESVDNAAKAAIFIGSNQLKIADINNPGPAVSEASVNTGAGGVGQYVSLASDPAGLTAGSDVLFTYVNDVTTGQAIGVTQPTATGFANRSGGLCTIFAAAGTYDISVQFKASSGSVTVKNRKLWVWTQAF